MKNTGEERLCLKERGRMAARGKGDRDVPEILRGGGMKQKGEGEKG